MTMYKIRITQSIWVDEERTEVFDTLYHDTELPFVPYPGLSITEDGWCCDPIEEVEWNAAEQKFYAEARDTFGYEDESAEDLRDREVRMYGWRSYKKNGFE